MTKVYMLENDNHPPELYWRLEDARIRFDEDNGMPFEWYVENDPEVVEGPDEYGNVSVDDGARISLVEIRGERYV